MHSRECLLVILFFTVVIKMPVVESFSLAG